MPRPAARSTARAARCRRTEEHPINPEAPYGVSKHTVEHYLYLWRLLHGLDYTVLRYPNVYGPRQNPHGEAGVNAIFIGLMLEGRRPRIFGTGDQVRDYLYVGDVVDANERALTRGGGEMVNIGTGVGTSVRQILRDALRDIIGFGDEPIYEAGAPGRSAADLPRRHAGEAVLDWMPSISFREGLERTVEWSRQHALPTRR